MIFNIKNMFIFACYKSVFHPRTLNSEVPTAGGQSHFLALLDLPLVPLDLPLASLDLLLRSLISLLLRLIFLLLRLVLALLDLPLASLDLAVRDFLTLLVER